MSPLSNTANSDHSSHTNPNSSGSQMSSSNTSSAFKPLMMSSDTSSTNSLNRGLAATSLSDQYNSDMAYAAYHNSASASQAAQEYHHSTIAPSGPSHQQHQSNGSAVGYKRELDEMATGGYSSYARPVKLYDHTTPNMEVYPPNTSGGFRNDAPSPGASIIDLSTSSVVTTLRSQAFNGGAYFDGQQRYDRSPQSASSPHYSSPQMLSPQGQTLDLSVGRTTLG